MMWRIKNIYSKTIVLADVSEGDLKETPINPQEEIIVRDIKQYVNIISLLDPSLGIIQIREEV